MRKLLAVASLVGAALVLGVSPASTAKIDDTNGGPVCADIIDGGISNYDPAAGTVTFALRTAAPSCRGILYTVNVYDDTAAHTFLGSVSTFGTKTAAPEGDGTGILFVTVSIPSSTTTQDSFCISATSSGDRVFDFAPNNSPCDSFPTPQSGSSGGQSPFN